jgi:hypothetical protein
MPKCVASATRRSQWLKTLSLCSLATCYGYVASPSAGTSAAAFLSVYDSAGESCESDTDVCREPYVCERGACKPPRYAPPVVSGWQADLAIPEGYALRDAWLVRDDTAGEQDSQARLLHDYRLVTSAPVTRSTEAETERFVFDVGLFKPGMNRFRVRGHAVQGELVRKVESDVTELIYKVPNTLGHLAPGRFRLPKKDFPRTLDDCNAAICKDRDRDGLNDLWENVAATQLRPRLMLDSGDMLLQRKADAVRVMTSVVPLNRNGRQYVLFASVIAFTRDYGYRGSWDHAGDTEAFGMLFRLGPDDTLRWVASTAKGHPCLLCDPRYHWKMQEFAGDGTPLLFVEKDKHGLWQNGPACRSESAFSCRSDHPLRPSAVNIGDYARHDQATLIDSLDGLAKNGPFGELAGLFPGDAIWTPAKARVHGRFCGGQRACSNSNSSNQPGTVIAALVRMFTKNASW